MNDQLTIKNMDGKEEIINVIDIVLDNETGKKYIFYTLNDSEEVYAAILIERDNAFIIEAITDDEEFSLVEEILNNKIRIEGGSDE